MDQYRNNDGSVRVGGTDTGPLPAQGSPQSGGQPTTYVPPELRPQGSVYPNYAGYADGTPPPPQPVATTQTMYRDRNHRHHRTTVLGPLLLISAGVVFLLNNMGVLPWSIWETLGRLWPLFLIAIGIDLIVGRRNPLFSLLIVVAVVGAGAALVYANGGFVMGSGEIASVPLNINLNGAASASVRVNMGTGTLTVGSMSSDTHLASGNLEYFGSKGAPGQEVSQSQAGSVENVEISQHDGGFNFGPFSSGRSLHWDVNLNRNVPIDLEVDQGTGNITLNLGQLQLKSLNFDAGTGNAILTLPSAAGNTNVEINGGVGNVTIMVPEGVEARIELNSGTGHTSIDSRFKKQDESTYVTSGFSPSDKSKNQVDIRLDQGVGNIDVRSSGGR